MELPQLERVEKRNIFMIMVATNILNKEIRFMIIELICMPFILIAKRTY